MPCCTTGRSGGRGSGSSSSGRGFYDTSSGRSGSGTRPSSSYGYGSGSGSGSGRSSSAPSVRGRLTLEQAVRDIKDVLKRVAAPKPAVTLNNGHVKRPNCGSVGKETRVLANHFRVARIEDGVWVWPFDVSIEKEWQPRKPRSGEDEGENWRGHRHRHTGTGTGTCIDRRRAELP